MIQSKGRAQRLCPLHYQLHLKELAASEKRNITRDGPCLAGDCDSPRRSRGLCANHYAYSRRRTTCPSCGGTKKDKSGLCADCHKVAVLAQEPIEKRCCLCHRTLPLDAFNLRKSAGGAAKWRSRCRKCDAAQARLRAKNEQRNRPSSQATTSYAGLRRYARKLNIPWTEVVERYPSDNRCEICKRTPEEAYRGDRYARLSLDHCHETGKLRGFLCGPCNSGVGHLGDTAARLRAAVKYLARDDRAGRDHHVDQDPIPGT
jgi:hypothetical protein